MAAAADKQDALTVRFPRPSPARPLRRCGLLGGLIHGLIRRRPMQDCLGLANPGGASRCEREQENPLLTFIEQSNAKTDTSN